MKEYSEFKQEVIPQIEVQLARFVAELEVIDPLRSAIHYALFPAGKRIRPLLALALCRDLGGDTEVLLPPACGIELLHASSLIHDDLPALDNDDFRRGRPSCHKQFGEATAILSGDLLIAAAFTLSSRPPVPASLGASIVPVLAQAFVDVCHGQQRDLLQGVERGSLDLLHRLKTGALFRASMQIAGLFCGLDAVNLEKISLYGESLGIYFQIVDDLIDLKGNEEQKGRPSGSDQRNQRETYGTVIDQEALEIKRQTIRAQMEFLLQEIEQGQQRPLRLVRNIFEQVEATIA